MLKGDFDTVFPIWLELLRKPAFRQDKIDLAKTQANTGISRRNDEPGGILGREVDEARLRRRLAVRAPGRVRDDRRRSRATTCSPSTSAPSTRTTSSWRSSATSTPRRWRSACATRSRRGRADRRSRSPTDAIDAAKPGVYFVAKDDVTQANIAMVHPGIERNNPDYYALEVMNEIFGGGFSGRLMQTLRSQQGLTYGVGGGVGATWDYPGLFRVQMATKSEHDARGDRRAARGSRAPGQRRRSPPTELSLAKESILNAFVFTMDTREKALNQQVLLEFYGFPTRLLREVPGDDREGHGGGRGSASRRSTCTPISWRCSWSATQKDFEKPLSTLGTGARPIDITIPEPGGSARRRPRRPRAATPKGTALFEEGRAVRRRQGGHRGSADARARRCR